MKHIEELLLDLECKLEELARKNASDDQQISKVRLMGYIDGVQDMRLAILKTPREKETEAVQEREVAEENNDTDLIREIVTMHKKINAILLLLKQIDFLKGERKDVKGIFGKGI